MLLPGVWPRRASAAKEAAPKAAAAKAKPAAARGQASPRRRDNGSRSRPRCRWQSRGPGGRRRSWRPSRPRRPSVSRAAKILADLQRPDLAKVFLQKVLAAKPTEQQLAALAEQFGAAMFLDLAVADGACIPRPGNWPTRSLAANNRQLQDPKRLAELIKQLQDPAEDVRAQAVAGLQDARGRGVEAAGGRAGRPGRAAEHAAVRAALVDMGRGAVGPLLAILAAGRPGTEGPGDPGAGRDAARGSDRLAVGARPAAGSDPRVRAAAEAALARLLGHIPSTNRRCACSLKQADRLPPAAAGDPRRKSTAA